MSREDWSALKPWRALTSRTTSPLKLPKFRSTSPRSIWIGLPSRSATMAAVATARISAHHNPVNRNLGEALRRRMGLSNSGAVERDIGVPLIASFKVPVRLAVSQEIESVFRNHGLIRSRSVCSFNCASWPGNVAGQPSGSVRNRKWPPSKSIPSQRLKSPALITLARLAPAPAAPLWPRTPATPRLACASTIRQ